MNMIIILFVSQLFAAMSPNCSYLKNPKVIKSSYSKLCYAEVKCQLYGVEAFNSVACLENSEGKCPSATACLNDKNVTFLSLKMSTLENTQKPIDNSEGVTK